MQCKARVRATRAGRTGSRRTMTATPSSSVATPPFQQTAPGPWTPTAPRGHESALRVVGLTVVGVARFGSGGDREPAGSSPTGCAHPRKTWCREQLSRNNAHGASTDDSGENTEMWVKAWQPHAHPCVQIPSFPLSPSTDTQTHTHRHTHIYTHTSNAITHALNATGMHSVPTPLSHTETRLPSPHVGHVPAHATFVPLGQRRSECLRCCQGWGSESPAPPKTPPPAPCAPAPRHAGQPPALDKPERSESTDVRARAGKLYTAHGTVCTTRKPGGNL